MAAPELFLLVPGLFGARGADAAVPTDPPAKEDVPALARLLARADAVHAGAAGIEAALFGLFGISSPEAGLLPVAPLTLLVDGGAPAAGYWLRADPVHLHAGQDKVVMTGSVPDVTREEAAELCREISAHFADQQLQLIAPTGARWYVRLPQPPAVRFSPFAAVLGRDIHPHLPQGEAGRDWRRWLNEIQMLLHASAVNGRRRSQGQSEVNSVWFWGGGERPPAGTIRYTAVWSDDPLASGLALNAGMTPLPPPVDAATWRGGADEGRHLVLLNGLVPPAQLGDPVSMRERWHDEMRRLHERWFEPLWELMRDKRLAALTIGSAGALDYHITPQLARRWWRRPRPWSIYT